MKTPQNPKALAQREYIGRKFKQHELNYQKYLDNLTDDEILSDKHKSLFSTIRSEKFDMYKDTNQDIYVFSFGMDKLFKVFSAPGKTQFIRLIYPHGETEFITLKEFNERDLPKHYPIIK